jgi:Glycosyl transferases group 1
MKLLYINKIDTNRDWGLENFIDRSLRKIEIETICIDYQVNAYSLANKLLSISENFDAVLLQRGCGYLIPLEIFQAIDRPKFFIFTELTPRNINQHYLLKSPLFEHIFLRSLPCIELAIANGWRTPERVSLFLSAIDPSFHEPLAGIEKDIDVLFVGTLLPRRAQIISALATSHSIVTSNLFGRDMVKLISRAKIILNIHGEDFLDTETRVYETLACRGFLLTETLSSENPFRSGTDLVEAADIQDLSAKITYYLNNPIEREAIANNGYLAVIQHHSFDERANQIDRVIRDYIPPQTPSTDPFDRVKLQRCLKQESYLQASDAFLSQSRRLLSSLKQKAIGMFPLRRAD